MAELELKGLHPDGEHLVLAGPDGRRHRLPIDDALRSAVRQDRPRPEQVRTGGELRPRDVQSRLRAGASPEEIALDAGVTVEHVRRYEGPVLAEQAWVAQQGRAMPVGREVGSPVLGDLALDRLARRGVEPEDLEWSAVRRPGEDWELVLRFHAGERDRVARWRVDLTSRVLHALDDEGRWLSETDLGGGGDSRRHLAAVAREGGDSRSRVYDVELDALSAGVSAVEVQPMAPAPGTPVAEDFPGRSAALDSTTAEILEGLRASRGVRQEIASLEEDEPAQNAEEPPAAHPPAGPARRPLDASVLPLRAVPPTPVGSARRDSSVGSARRDSSVGSARRDSSVGSARRDSSVGSARRDSSVGSAGREDVSPPEKEPAGPAAEEGRVRRPRPGSPSPRRRGQQHSEPAAQRPDASAEVGTTDGVGAWTPEEVGAQATEEAAARAQRRPKPRSRRTSVPSWDEIVFGAKPE